MTPARATRPEFPVTVRRAVDVAPPDFTGCVVAARDNALRDWDDVSERMLDVRCDVVTPRETDALDKLPVRDTDVVFPRIVAARDGTEIVLPDVVAPRDITFDVVRADTDWVVPLVVLRVPPSRTTTLSRVVTDDVSRLRTLVPVLVIFVAREIPDVVVICGVSVWDSEFWRTTVVVASRRVAARAIASAESSACAYGMPSINTAVQYDKIRLIPFILYLYR